MAKLAGQLRSSPLQGLSHGGPQGPKDAGVRMQAFGVNRLPEPPSVSFLQLVWEALQVRAPLTARSRSRVVRRRHRGACR